MTLQKKKATAANRINKTLFYNLLQKIRQWQERKISVN